MYATLTKDRDEVGKFYNLSFRAIETVVEGMQSVEQIRNMTSCLDAFVKQAHVNPEQVVSPARIRELADKYKIDLRILSPDAVYSRWNELILQQRTKHDIPCLQIASDNLFALPYTEGDLIDTFEKCASHNQRLNRRLKLVLFPYPGFSLSYLYQIVGTDKTKNVYFRNDFKNWDWWQSHKNMTRWANVLQPAGMRLLCLDSLFADSDYTWYEQDQMIVRQFGKQCMRPSTALSLSALITLRLLGSCSAEPGAFWTSDQSARNGKKACIRYNGHAFAIDRVEGGVSPKAARLGTGFVRKPQRFEAS